MAAARAASRAGRRAAWRAPVRRRRCEPGVDAEAAVRAGAGRARRSREAGLELLCPMRKAGRLIALLGLGPRADGRPFGVEEIGVPAQRRGLRGDAHRERADRTRSCGGSTATLSVKVFQLHNLFDISRELTASLDEEAIERLVVTTLMGHLLRLALRALPRAAGGLDLAPRARRAAGQRARSGCRATPRALAARAAEPARRGRAARRERCEDALVGRATSRSRCRSLAPGRLEGLLAVGDARPGARAFGEEDHDFARTLARQALAALESVRLHRCASRRSARTASCRSRARSSRACFPSDCAAVPGFELAAASHSCHQVGGDYYDFIPLEGGRLALAIADVSGKGTPASILMASVHASLRALAGSAPGRRRCSSGSTASSTRARRRTST